MAGEHRTTDRAAISVRHFLPPYGPAGGRIALAERLATVPLWAGACLARDLDAGRGACWVAVAFALGCLGYGVLPAEPSLVALGLAASAASVVALTIRRRRRGFVPALLAALLAGLFAGKLEAERVEAPRLDRERTVTLAGWVVFAEPTPRGTERVLLRVRRMEARGLEEGVTPTFVTVTLARRDTAPPAGTAIELLARLRPPSGPVLPGGYDFARRAFFDGRGAAGYALGRVRPVDLGSAPWRVRMAAPLATLRHDIGERIRAALPGPTGAVAAALIVGEQRGVPDDMQDALRATGLSHILSISGLHMSLVAGGVYAAVRIILALLPSLALTLATAKIAAVAGFLAATVYLGLSGAGVATLRAYLMFAVLLLGVLCDRPAVTLRSVAVAAVAVMAVSPSSVAEPGFQMSFLAVLALVALYEGLAVRAGGFRTTRSRGRAATLLHDGLRAAGALALTSIVAGLATAPIVADTFYRAAPYGGAANLLVLPVVSFVVMPAAVVAGLAMPFGLEALPLAAMGLGIDVMVGVARWIAGWPGGDGIIGRVHPLAAPLAVAGILWLCLWQAAWRWLGLIPAVAGVAVAPFAAMPDVLISANGEVVAVRGLDGRLAVINAKADRFAVETWLTADADTRPPLDPTLSGGWRCDGLGCTFGPLSPRPPTTGPPAQRPPGPLPTGPPDRKAAAPPPDLPDAVDVGGRPALRVAVVRDVAGFDEDCRWADIVVTRLAAPPGCAAHAVVVDETVLARQGATALHARSDADGRVRVVATAARPAARRPWSPAPAATRPAEPPRAPARPRFDPTAEPDPEPRLPSAEDLAAPTEP